MSEVEVIEKTISVCKESNEVFEAVSSVIADIKKGKSVSEIASGNLPKLMTAVDGYEQLDDEYKSEHFGSTVAYGVGLIAESLRVKPDEAE